MGEQASRKSVPGNTQAEPRNAGRGSVSEKGATAAESSPFRAIDGEATSATGQALRAGSARSDVLAPESRGWSAESIVHDGAVSLALLPNPSGAIRIVDLRPGRAPEKRATILREALGMHATKVFAVVERGDVANWLALGFVEEATIPNYFRAFVGGVAHRPDGIVVGMPVHHPNPPPEPRIFLARGGRDIELRPEVSTAQDRANRASKVALRELEGLDLSTLPTVTLHPMDEADARRSRQLAQRAGTAMTSFAPFARRGVRSHFVALGRVPFAAVASIEVQPNDGNAFLELLESPSTMDGVLLTMAAVDSLVAVARSRGASSLFAFAPSDDEGLAMAYLQAGFQRTGLLSDHYRIGDARKDATVWWR